MVVGKSPKRLGIFCLEGPWREHLKDRASVEHMMHLLAAEYGSRLIYIHRTIATIEELRFYLRKWALKSYADYPVLYLAFHGRKSCICLGRKRIHLRQIKQMITPRRYKSMIYFGSCKTMGASANALNEFMADTCVLGLMGYTQDVDWIESTAFELLVHNRLQAMPSLTLRSLQKVSRDLEAALASSEYYKALGFRVVMKR